MSSLSSDILVTPSDLFATVANVSTAGVPYTTQPVQVGVRAVTGDGREFRYIQAGASNLLQGKLMQGPANFANFGLTLSTQSVGDVVTTVTLNGTAVTANQFAGGYLFIQTATLGAGQTLQIASHPAQASTSGTVVLTLTDPYVVATTGSPTGGFILNPYTAVIVNPTSQTGQVVGVTFNPITALYYGWIQVHGLVDCLNDGNTTIGLGVAPSTNTAGAVFTATSTGFTVGEAVMAGTTTAYSIINLNL